MKPTTLAADTDRHKVWIALSDLFLDTDISLYHSLIATALAKSPYSIEELEQILIVEVRPVLKSNLSIWGAWIWTGFDQEWLISECSKRINKKPSWFNRNIYQPIQEDWVEIKKKVLLLRQNNS